MLLTEAKISMARDDLQSAQKGLAIVLEQQPNNVEALYLEGYIYSTLENWSKMYDSFSKIKRFDPLYEKDNITNLSLKAFGMLRNTGINDKFNKAVYLLNNENDLSMESENLLKSALSDLELADKFKSDDFLTKDIIATIYLQLSNKEKAIEMFNQAISFAKRPEDNKNVVSAYFNLYNIYLENGENSKAFTMISNVLELDSMNREALLQLAKHYEGINDYDNALIMYNKLVEIEPTNTDILFNQGVLFSKNKSTEKAIQNFKKIIEINPNDEETIYFLTVFYNEKGMYQEIVSLIEPKYEGFSTNYKEKLKDYIQIALVKVGRAKDAKKYFYDNFYTNNNLKQIETDLDLNSDDQTQKKITQSEKPKTYKDSDGPIITLYEPRMSRGLKINEKNKQILIKGKADDKSGIFSVIINGEEAELKENGEFQRLVNLAVGNNQIKIQATDTKENISEYSFVAERKSNIEYKDYSAYSSKNTSEKRLALIIGNSNYNTAGQKLKNPVNDASLIASTLQELGFEVIINKDANKKNMENAIKEFSRKLPNYNVALFYYAGHGVQVDGNNYLIPVDAELKEKNDCKFEAVSVNFVVEEFEKYPDNTNIVILDACRNNPFRSWSRGGNEGFRAIAPSSGTIIAFATSEGATASDGTDNNGLYTRELSKQMKEPQPVESVFKNTRNEVERLSNYSQSPQEWTKLKGDFWFIK